MDREQGAALHRGQGDPRPGGQQQPGHCGLQAAPPPPEAAGVAEQHGAAPNTAPASGAGRSRMQIGTVMLSKDAPALDTVKRKPDIVLDEIR